MLSTLLFAKEPIYRDNKYRGNSYYLGPTLEESVATLLKYCTVPLRWNANGANGACDSVADEKVSPQFGLVHWARCPDGAVLGLQLHGRRHVPHLNGAVKVARDEELPVTSVLLCHQAGCRNGGAINCADGAYFLPISGIEDAQVHIRATVHLDEHLLFALSLIAMWADVNIGPRLVGPTGNCLGTERMNLEA